MLVSYHLCPYVQRAAIAADEEGIALRREFIDLSAKPDWFLALSPTGKVPLLRVGEAVLFESAAICEYLDETSPSPALLPADPLGRARHRRPACPGALQRADEAVLHAEDRVGVEVLVAREEDMRD